MAMVAMHTAADRLITPCLDRLLLQSAASPNTSTRRRAVPPSLQQAADDSQSQGNQGKHKNYNGNAHLVSTAPFCSENNNSTVARHDRKQLPLLKRDESPL